MRKVEIDYSNTIIYKIICKVPSITDVYVGHTTNFVQRKQCHKQSCNNDKNPNNNCKLYKVIRENGGWENWSMEIINFFKCSDHYEARQKEQEYFTLLNATLNSIEPMPKQNEKAICNKIVKNENMDEVNTNKHDQFLDNHLSINSLDTKDFVCKLCKFTCCKPSNWKKHLMTVKHNNNFNTDFKYNCCCGKKYKYRQGLFKHKKKCMDEQPKIDLNSIDANLIIQLLKQNDEFKNMMIEQNNKLIEVYKNGVN